MARGGRKIRGILQRSDKHIILNPTTYLVTLPKVARIEYYVFWPLVGLILLSAIYMLSESPIDGLKNELYLPFIVVGATVWMGITSALCADKLEKFLHLLDQLCCDPNDCRARMKNYIDKIFSWKWHVFTGIIMCLGLVTLVYTRTNGFTNSHDWYGGKFGYWPFLVGWAITSYFIGGGLIIVIGTMLIPGRLAKEKIKLNMHSYKKSAIRSLSTTFIIFSVSIFVAALFAVAGVVGSPNKSDLGLILMYFGFLWISFVYAVWTQWGIHEVLIKGKLVILDNLAEKFEEELDRIRKGIKPEIDTEDRVNWILALRREVVSFPDWTLNPGNFSAIFIPSFSGTIALVVKFKNEILTLLGIGK